MRIVGMMSGTSADGIDAALCEIDGAPPKLQVRMIRALARPYPQPMRQRILDACRPETGRVDSLCRLNVDLAEAFASVALEVIAAAGLTPDQVDLIASHGQTVWHQVEADGHVSATFQIGEGAVIAERTGITTINNFRARDVAAGGHGAPLVSYADWILLRHPEHWRAVQNIGGIGNVTFLPPLTDSSSAPLAFDTGPGNVLIDAVVALLTGGAQTYDRDGQMARQGRADAAWLEALLRHPYYERRPPKTTGRELFTSDMAQSLLADGQARGLGPNDIVATMTALTAHTIADAYRRFAPAAIGEAVLAGGGSRNPTLVGMIASLLAPAPVLTHEALGIDSDFKEAMIFALLAHETWHNRPGSLPALTGASHPVVMGQITPGRNFPRLTGRA